MYQGDLYETNAAFALPLETVPARYQHGSA